MFHQQKLYDGVYQIWYTLFFASQNKEITRIMNLLDIIGPVMVGPSSSHTAGAVKIGRVCHKLLAEKVVRADIFFHGSFLATGKGHGTDKAVVAGLLGMLPDDTRIPDALDIADEQMALAGITSAIPVDEVIDAMRRIGADMSDTLKETARGGLATTRTALEVKNRLKM